MQVARGQPEGIKIILGIKNKYMNQAVLVIIGIVVGGLVVWVSVLRKGRTRLRQRLRRGKEAAAGICASAIDQTVRKNVNKEKALAFLQEKKEASNEEIREHLKSVLGREVTRRTVVRYLDGLEREGKVEQVGDIGRGVMYRVK